MAVFGDSYLLSCFIYDILRKIFYMDLTLVRNAAHFNIINNRGSKFVLCLSKPTKSKQCYVVPEKKGETLNNVSLKF